MNRDSTEPVEQESAAVVDLAREPAFDLAQLSVTPAARTVAAGAWAQRIEPRAMQVLVVLARAAPEVVGRETLNRLVWGGRIVGDDAINRAVQTLRRLAAEAPSPPPFAIDTIARVGYRLIPANAAAVGVEPEPAAPVDEGAPAQPRGRGGWRPIAAAIAVAISMVIALLWWWAGARAPAATQWRIATATSLDDLPGDASDVTLTPDGRRLAFRGRDADGHERIFVRATADRGGGVAISPPGLDARGPAWSPTGADLAFAIYDPAQPCRLYVARGGLSPAPVGSCETVREPHLAWSADGEALIFGDAPGVNAVLRIRRLRIADGRRDVLSSPPGDSMGDTSPIASGTAIVFQRQFGWADEGWIVRDAAGGERLLWRRRGVAGSVAAVLPDGTLAVAWTQAGVSGLDFVGADGRARPQSVALGPVAALAAAGPRLIVESDRAESALVRADVTGAAPVVAMRGQIAAPLPLPDGRLRFPVMSAGVARLWERGADGALRPWGTVGAARISGIAPSPDGRLTALMTTGDAGREIVVLDAAGRPGFRWNPHARSLNPAAWSADGRRLVAPVLDGAGWRLFALDPFGGAPPRDMGLPGFAVVLAKGSALYAVRAGETTGTRELWRLDGQPRRLPIDLTLLDIVNWRPADGGVWLPDRTDRARPLLVLRDEATGRVLRRVPAPGLAGAGRGLAADARGPIYVRAGPDAPDYRVLTLTRAGD